MTNPHLTPAQLVASWRPSTSPREQALAAIMREGNDRVTAAIILDAREARAFVGPCSGGVAGYCQCDECGEMYAQESADEMAAEARNEAALYGPTPEMLDDFARGEEMGF